MDHPRSRGVYDNSPRNPCGHEGSSPLARGLPFLEGLNAVYRRIIPARAGFTSSARAPGRAARDHPRSRGVYTRSRPSLSRRLGSSPLARGLLERRRDALSGRGIIPARAGFTAPAILKGSPCGDHPRSRGVYVALRGVERAGQGSSPLARGLPTNTDVTQRYPGIIPARAGFTSARSETPE